MDILMTLICYAGATFVLLALLVFAIYWFELDTKLLRAIEPIFRKLTD